MKKQLMRKNQMDKNTRIREQTESPPFMNDGYANAAAFLGDDSPLFTAGTFVRSGLTSDPDLLTAMYRESWLTMRIIDMPSEDMTRAWYKLSAALPDADLHALRRLEARHSVKQEITNALRWARLYGGSLALMVIRGEEDRLDQPLIPDLSCRTVSRACWCWTGPRGSNPRRSWSPIWTIRISACRPAIP